MKLCPSCKACHEDTDKRCECGSHTPLEMQRAGARIIGAKYRLDKLLGHGGTGAVYRCTHLELDRPMAIKLLRPDFANSDPNGRLRLRREALTSCNFDHKNLVRLIDFGTSKIQIGNNGSREFYDELYIVMELVEGETLKDHIAQHGQLTFGEAIEIAIQIAAALVEVHRNGVVHRDIKPANVMLTYDHDGMLVAKLLDFGAVKLSGQMATMPLPDIDLTGQMFIGSPQYASPESCLFKPLDGRSDLYCVGLILYQMIAGRLPFAASDVVSWLSKHAHDNPQQLIGAPQPLADFVMRALSKLPSHRPQSAGDFLANLKRIKTALGPIANEKAAPLAEEDEVDTEDEITRIAASQRKPVVTTPTKPRPTVPGRKLSKRMIVGILLLILSPTASLFLTLTFLRKSLNYVPIADTSNQSAAPMESESDEFVTITDVNIRSYHSGFSERVGLAEKGSRVKVVEKHKNWRRILVIQHGRNKEDPASSDRGWIDGDNLTALSDNPT